MKNILLSASTFFSRPSITAATTLTLVLISTLILTSTSTFAQGTLKENGRTMLTIPQYDLSNGDTEWIINNTQQLRSYKWLTFFEFENMTGTLDGLLTVYVSGNEGTSWVTYPNLSADSVNANKSISFDDSYTIFDQIKIVFTANSISGGTVNVNQRLISNPK